MRKMLCCATVLAVVNLLLIADVSHGQKTPAQKKNATKVEEATSQDHAALAQAKEVTGVVTYVDVALGRMTFRMEFQQLVPNTTTPNNNKLNANQQALLRSQQQLMRDYQQL